MKVEQSVNPSLRLENPLRNIDYRQVIERMKENENIRKVFYFLMEKNPSGALPYHGNVHSLTVAMILNEVFKDDLGLCEAATIAGLCHDFAHAGVGDSKAPNIETAIEKTIHMWPEGLDGLIRTAIGATYFPYKFAPESLDLTTLEGRLQMAIRLADLAWQNLYPIDIAQIGIHQEQYKETEFSKVEEGTKEFKKYAKALYKDVGHNLPKQIAPIYALFLSR